MNLRSNRRDFFKAGAVLAGAAAIPSAAAAPAPKAAVAPYKLSVAAYSCRKFLNLKNPTMTLGEFIDQCYEWGVEGTELTQYFFKQPITHGYIMGLKRRALKQGLDITGTPIGNRFTLPAGEKRDREIKKMNDWIDVSADLGSPAIRIFAGRAPKGTDEAVARKWCIECIETCLKHAEKRGVVLAMENHGGIVSDSAGMLALINALKSDWFGVNLDTGNFHTPDPYADMERCAPYAVTVQLKVELSYKGKREETDYARIIKMLRQARYRGYLTLEYEAREDPMTAVPKHLAALRKLAS